MPGNAATDITARAAADRFLEIQQCGKPGCKCTRAARAGHGLTHCPLHADNSPSFNVTVKDDKLLVCCEAGCIQQEVVEQFKALDLWPQKAEYGKQIVAEYDYRDANGKLLYQAVRYFPKDFRQRRPNGPGQWVWNLDGVDRVLYRLPELLDSSNRVVFVVEGEKDVDRLMAAGFVATSNVGGAGKWRDEYSEHLRCRQVVLVPDNDEAGRQHCLQVANSLFPVQATVRWLELPGLPEKGDVSEWMDAGGTAAQLRELAAAAGGPPAPKKRERVFEREGMGYRFEPAGLPVVMRFSRIADRRDETTAELQIGHATGGHILRRRVNLLTTAGVTLKSIGEELNSEELGLDVEWSRILRDGFESVLDAHRNGIVVRSVGGEIERPPPPKWLCDGLVLKDKVNCWLGAAGTGKSTLAKTFCVYYAAGFQFLNRHTEKGLALYLDWEDDEEDLKRVAHDTCRNLGVWPVPELLYISMRGKRLRDHVEWLATLVDQRKIGLIVLDAIAAAGGSPGEHMSWEAVALELEQCLGLLPPVTILGLDHVTSDEHKNGHNVVPTKARGAERKVEFVRNQWTLVLDRGEQEVGKHVVSWNHTKVNVIVPRMAFTTELVHRDGELSVVERGIEASPAAVERMPVSKQNVLYVAENPGKTVEHICVAVRGQSTRNMIEATRMELRRASKRGEVWSDETGKWWPGPPPNALQTLSNN